MKKITILFIICIISTLLYGCQFNRRDGKTLTDEEIKNSYSRANEIIKMFWGSGVPADESDKYTDDNNNLYFAVKYENINSLNDLYQHLNSIFSAQIADELMSIRPSYCPRFLEIDDKLYQNSNNFTVGLINCSIIEKESYIQKISDTKYIYSMDKVLYEDDHSDIVPEIYRFDYVCEKEGDKWLFTEFPIVKPFTELSFDYSNFNSDYHIVTEVEDTSIVEQMYDNALEAYSWFSTYAGITMVSGYSVSVGNGPTYSRVYNNNYKRLKDMENYLCTLFSGEIVEVLISNRTFIDIDGQLYFSEASAGFNSMKIKDTSIEKINDNKYIYYVHLIETFPDDTDEGKEIYTVQYPYEYIDGRWVFTDFPSFRKVNRK